MTLTVIISLTVASLVKILLTCQPSGVAEWVYRKFEVHSKLSVEHTTIVFEGNKLEGPDKAQFINEFNHATLFEKYYVHPGNEQSFLQPESNEIPFVIHTKQGKQDVNIFIYRYDKYVDVVRQYKKKVVAYSVLSDHLQKHNPLLNGELVLRR